MLSLSQIRPEERRHLGWAALTMFLVLVAHSLLETARDALFLTHLPASQLPWVYLALAALALLGTRALGRSSGARSDLHQLVAMQLVAAAVTAAFLFFALLAPAKPPWALYALYLWGGLASTVILIRFWLLLGDRCTPSQAKRLFPIIAAAALCGSLAGYGVAGAAARMLPPADLLGLAALGFLLSAGGSLGMRAGAASDERDESESAPSLSLPRRPAEGVPAREGVQEREGGSAVAAFREALRHPYVRRVGLLLLIASVTATLGDFIFKSVVARTIEPRELGEVDPAFRTSG